MTTEYQLQPSLFESLARRAGYGALEERLSVAVDPLLLWAITLVVVDVVVLQGYKQLQGHTATFLTNPAWLVQPVFALLAAWAVAYLRERYARALDEIDVGSRTQDPTRFTALSPRRLTLALYAAVLGYTAWNVLVNAGVGRILRIGGVAELVGSAVVAPGYGLVFAEFLATYVTIMLLLPRAIRHSDFRLNYLDPEGLGGLRPVGELAKTAYYFIVVGLVGYLVFTYGPYVLGEVVQSGYPRPGAVVNAAFTAAWLLTIGTMAYGLSQLHWFMKREKRRELTRLDRLGRDAVEHPFDVQELTITDDEAFDDVRRRMEFVSATKEYPTTFTMWSQILLTLILPKAVQLALTGV